jgi:hypothetical protein
VDAGRELALQRAPGGGADLADLRASLADQDPLLGLRLRPHLSPHRDQAVLPPGDLAYDDLDRVRDLLPGPVEDLFADQLGQHQLARLVAAVLRRIQVGPLRNQLPEPFDQYLQPFAAARADREDLVDALQLGCPRERLHGRPSTDPIELVDRAEDRYLRPGGDQRAGDEAVPGADALLPVDDEQHHVGIGQLALDSPLHALGQRVAGTLHARQIDEDQLPFRLEVGGDPADRAAGGLRSHRDDRDLGPDQGVDQSRLADVGTSGEPDEAAARHRNAARISPWSSSISPSSTSWS